MQMIKGLVMGSRRGVPEGVFPMVDRSLLSRGFSFSDEGVGPEVFPVLFQQAWPAAVCEPWTGGRSPTVTAMPFKKRTHCIAGIAFSLLPA